MFLFAMKTTVLSDLWLIEDGGTTFLLNVGMHLIGLLTYGAELFLRSH
jgi:hypothetical protein